jgi:hypothetical protein
LTVPCHAKLQRLVGQKQAVERQRTSLHGGARR